MLGFQAAGSAPIYHGRIVEKPDTLATAIRIGNPASWQGARSAVEESGGAIDIVTDEEILAAQRWLASHEGIFVEPASAASVAGLLRCLGHERCAACPLPTVPPGGKIVLTVTGHGLKDPEAVARSGAVQPMECDADSTSIRKLLER
jgi:threonine synthase